MQSRVRPIVVNHFPELQERFQRCAHAIPCTLQQNPLAVSMLSKSVSVISGRAALSDAMDKKRAVLRMSEFRRNIAESGRVISTNPAARDAKSLS